MLWSHTQLVVLSVIAIMFLQLNQRGSNFVEQIETSNEPDEQADEEQYDNHRFQMADHRRHPFGYFCRTSI
jgi:hypothetical protein